MTDLSICIESTTTEGSITFDAILYTIIPGSFSLE